MFFLASLILTCVGLSACKSLEDYAKELVEAQNKTEKLRDFGMKLSASVEFRYGYANVTKRVEEQYICYGSGQDRRIYTDSVEEDDRPNVYYYVGNLRYTYYGQHCESCKRVKDSEINKKPFNSEKISDFDGAEIDRSTTDGNYVYSATLTKEIVLNQLKELDSDIPSDVEFDIKDEYKCTYTVDKKTGYLVEYYVPECNIGFRIKGGEGWQFFDLSYKLSIVTDRNELKIDYPETFEEYEKYYTAQDCFIGSERFENQQALDNVWASNGNYEKQYNFDKIYSWACDSKTGALAVGYFTNATETESCVDVYDKDMKKISTFSFYGTTNSLSMENGKLAVVIIKKPLGSLYKKYDEIIYVFDLTSNSLIYKTSAPDSGLAWSVVLYGDAIAYYAEYSDTGLYVYNFTSGKTIVPELNSSSRVWNVGKTPSGRLTVLKQDYINGESADLIFDIDEEGVVSANKILTGYVSSYTGMYWGSYNYFANTEEELTSLGVEYFSGADVPENAEVIYYDGQHALVKGADKTLLVCDVKREEYILCCTELSNRGWYFKAGEYCWCYRDSNSIYMLDISPLVAANK